jgi:hypothetical protein
MLAALGAGLIFGAPITYGSELTQAERSAPIVADSLAEPSSLWQTTTDPTGQNFVYAHGSYQVSSECCELFTLANTPVQGGVVEVTLHTENIEDFAQSGLILRASPATGQALIFAISPDGGWRLQRYTLIFGAHGSYAREGEQLIDFTPPPAIYGINTGRDVTNRLAVIMRGRTYTFFANGHYIGSYHDSQVAGDQIGIYSEGVYPAGALVAFSDFAIYPLPPTSIPWL